MLRKGVSTRHNDARKSIGFFSVPPRDFISSETGPKKGSTVGTADAGISYDVFLSRLHRPPQLHVTEEKM